MVRSHSRALVIWAGRLVDGQFPPKEFHVGSNPIWPTFLCYNKCTGSSIGRVPDCQAGCCGFESRSVLFCVRIGIGDCNMARPKKEKKVEVPEESLSKVLSPGYTLEIQQELTIVGPDEPVTAEADKVENHEFFTLPTGDSINLDNPNLRRGLIGFNVMFDENTLSSKVQMIMRMEGSGTRKIQSTYRLEDLMDSLAFGVKIDAYERVKNSQGDFGFDIDINAVKVLSSKLTKDLNKFTDELQSNGIILKTPLTVQHVAIGIHDQNPIAALFEVVR